MMNVEEIKLDLIRFVKGFYEDADVLYLDITKKEVELRLHVMEKDREEIKAFYENNRKIFKDETIKTNIDLAILSEVSIRVDKDGIFFGKSSFDFLATNVVAFYLLEKYLNDLMEELPKKLEEYRLHNMAQ
ncbi:MAG: hypothetical protein GX829_07275 [Clostridium sp.]|nr:hypothetical protein [Clostridium sp.]